MADTLSQHSAASDALRAEIDSLFAVQTLEPTRTVAGMENQYFYFLALVIFVLLAFILYDRHQVNKTIKSSMQDMKELAKMKSDFSRLTALMQEIKNPNRLARMPRNNESVEVEPQVRRFAETQVVVPVKELQQLQAYKRLYQEDIENIIEKKSDHD